MKIIILIFLLIAPLYDEPTSRIRLFQTGTVSVKYAEHYIEQYRQFGCKEIGVFDVAPERVNVYCLDMLVAE